MASGFTKFMIGLAKAPATIFGGIVGFVFGYTKRNKNGEPMYKGKQEVTSPGLIGSILNGIKALLNGIKALSRGVGNLVLNHQTAITTATWASLAVGGAIALTLFLSPAALAAVAGFSVYGFSIAGLAGANTLMQIGLAAGVAFAATSAATYLTAAVVNFISACCCKHPRERHGVHSQLIDNDNDNKGMLISRRHDDSSPHRTVGETMDFDISPADMDFMVTKSADLATSSSSMMTQQLLSSSSASSKNSSALSSSSSSSLSSTTSAPIHTTSPLSRKPSADNIKATATDKLDNNPMVAVYQV